MRGKNDNRARRHRRVRAKVVGTAERPRLSVFRSNKHFYVQLINDHAGRTLVAARDTEVASTRGNPKKDEGKMGLGGKLILAHELGKLIADKAKKAGVAEAVFDRGGYRYHGLVKAIAEGAREGSLSF